MKGADMKMIYGTNSPRKARPAAAFLAACAAALVLPALSLASCATISASLDSLGVSGAALGIDSESLGTLKQTSDSFSKVAEDITPEQEYYIGRSVGAAVFQAYPAYDKAALTNYLNRLGQTLVLYSERPALFKGYHFIALDTDEVNAFATPSGLVMVSRGLIKLTTSEDELAAVLAHEISHVTSGHGLKSIRSARLNEALGLLAKNTGVASSAEDLIKLTGAFSDSINDITKTMITSGYSKTAEFDADLKAVKILRAAGYDARALERVLVAMKAKSGDAKGFSKTHPDPQTRIDVLKKSVSFTGDNPSPAPAARKKRYAAGLKPVK